jgi:hypothetical protein
MTWRTRATGLVAAALLVALVVGLAGPSPRAAGATDRSPRGGGDDPAGRVLIFSVPTLSWQDLADFEAPHLESLLDDSAIADLSVRGVTRRTSADDAYTTISAGTRAEGTTSAALAFQVGDIYEGQPAAEEFARRTGVTPVGEEIFNFGMVSLLATNERLLYGAEVGAFGDALSDGGVQRAVIANGDHREGEDVELQREATVGLLDGRGIVPSGAIDERLLQDDPDAPYGTRYDNGAVVEAFDELWGDEPTVALVEASDFVRYDDFRPLATDAQRRVLKAQALRHSDELFGELLDRVDLSRDAVMIVAPYAEAGGVSTTVVGLHTPDMEPGFLSSGTTRRPGFVQTVDVAPTVLDHLGLELDSSMEGTPMEWAERGGSAASRRSFLIEANEAALFRDSIVGAASTLFVVAQLVLWVLAVLSITRAMPRLGRGVEIGALCVLGYLPATYLAGFFPFYRWGSPAYWLFVVVVAAAIGVTCAAIGGRRLVDPLLLALGTVIGLLTIDVLTGVHLQLNTVFGYTPTVAGRFAGIGNPAFAMLSASAIIAAPLLAYRIGGRRGIWTGVALLAGCVVLDGMPFWGADVGGVLALVPAAGVTAWFLLGYRIRVRTAALLVAAAVALVVAFGALDLTRPAERRTHLGRLLADIGTNGYDAFETVVLRKLDANLSVLTSSVWTLMLPVVFAFVAYLFWRAPWRLHTIQETIPQERAALAGLITAMVLGFALNDSGIAVPGMMLGVANAALVHLVLRVGSDREPSGEGTEIDDHRRLDEPATDEGVDPVRAATVGDGRAVLASDP